MSSLQFKDLYLGKIDANNEFLTFGKETCKDLFFEFPNINMNSIVNGSVYYICGDKGTGKTMLLKYVETCIQDQDKNAGTTFIRFKRDIDSEERNTLKRIASLKTQSEDEIIDNTCSLDKNVDCVLGWELFLIKTIVFKIDKNKLNIFVKDKNWGRLIGLLKEIYKTDDSKKRSWSILPKMRRGNIEVNIANLSKLALDFEWEKSDSNGIPFKIIAQKAIDLFFELSPNEFSYYVFIDELELSFKKNKQYDRDVILIRDLIFAIQYLSEEIKKNDFNVHFLAAIRNEVYRYVKSLGEEINKPISDFGIELSWKQKGGAIKEHPLLKMLEKRIRYSEEKNGVEPSKDVWGTYFAPVINKTPICNYIVNQTWNKPRDIIRLFSIIQKQFGDISYCNQAIFDAIRQQYSQESWDEIAESLTAIYSDVEVEGIRHVLTGISLPFRLTDFIRQIDGNSETFIEVEQLKNGKNKPAVILRDLYDAGVIGNYGNIPRFIFLGDRDIDPTSPVTIHYPLIKFFRASIKKFERDTASQNEEV